MGPLSSGFSKRGSDKPKNRNILQLINFCLFVVLFRFFIICVFSAAAGLLVFVFLCPFIFVVFPLFFLLGFLSCLVLFC